MLRHYERLGCAVVKRTTQVLSGGHCVLAAMVVCVCVCVCVSVCLCVLCVVCCVLCVVCCVLCVVCCVLCVMCCVLCVVCVCVISDLNLGHHRLAKGAGI